MSCSHSVMKMMIYGLLALVYADFVLAECDQPSYKFCDSMKQFCQVPEAKAYLQMVCPITCGYCKKESITKFSTAAPGFSTTVPAHLPYTGTCGRPHILGVRIIAGTTAIKGAWPWQILLMKMGEPICGGTLISLNWVVTAAHCVYGSDDKPYFFTVRTGEYRLSVKEESEKNIVVEKVIIHPRFNWMKINNDIALLKLHRPIQLNKFVSPACLPSMNPPVGMTCMVTGWGQTHFPGHMANVLQQGSLPVVSNEACAEKNKKVIHIAVTPNMICGGSGGISRLAGCHGDSGGPFVCHINGRWELQGTVSHGSPICNSTETYTVFSRTYYFKDWIEDTMKIN